MAETNILPKGFSAAGLRCGLKKSPRKKDLALFFSDRPASAAGSFTTNLVVAAPLSYTKEIIRNGQLQAVVANSGNANACTGTRGYKDARKMAGLAARLMKIPPELVAVASTGIIGKFLPMREIRSGIIQAAKILSGDGGPAAAEAIRTTDTFAKIATASFNIKSRKIKIWGAAKGSGMIHPRMTASGQPAKHATMLAFILTDAAIGTANLQKMLDVSVDRTFNMVTVDGDTSTNDMVLVLANGAAGNRSLDPASPEGKKFARELENVCQELAKDIARDGEGAEKLIEVTVDEARTAKQAGIVARTIAVSPLVKTAIAGSNPNWGRILTAAGYSGTKIRPDKISLWLGPVQVYRRGKVLNFDRSKARQFLSTKEAFIKMSLGLGRHQATAWGCDLTTGYIRINTIYS